MGWYGVGIEWRGMVLGWGWFGHSNRKDQGRDSAVRRVTTYPPHCLLRSGHATTAHGVSPADSCSLLHTNHLPLRSSQMLVDTALERPEAELSNAVSTTAWKARNGE